ncbi:hypothetical protein JCM10213v2_001391 [Rhodosporidiobolus nylandii]
MPPLPWRTKFDTTVNDVRRAFLDRADLIEKYGRTDARVKDFGKWSNTMKEAAESIYKCSHSKMRTARDADRERLSELKEEAQQQLEGVRDRVKAGGIATVADLSQSQYRERDEVPPARRSRSPPPELRSLAVLHRRLSHRQAQIYGTTQQDFAEGRAFF